MDVGFLSKAFSTSVEMDDLFAQQRKPLKKEKDNPQKGRKSLQWSGQNGINLQNTQTIYTSQQIKQQPNGKMGKRSEQTFLQRRYTEG